MDTHAIAPGAGEEQKFNGLRADVRKQQPVLARARDIVSANASLAVTGVALVGVVAACLVTRLLGRR